LNDLIYKKAEELLLRRPHFKNELKFKLLNKNFLEEEITEVLSFLESKGFIDDVKYGKLYIEELLNKKYGRYKIRIKLKNKGFSDDEIKSLFKNFMFEDLEIESINYILEKERHRDFKKLALFLINRGFDKSLVLKSLKKENLSET
jgi:regulatory protein